MGFLIFAFRKLTLRKNIDRKQFSLMSVSMKLQKIQDQVSIMQQAKTSTQNALQMMTQSAASMAGSLFQTEMSGAQNTYSEKTKAYTEALKAANNDDSADAVVAAKDEVEKAKDAATEKYQSCFSKYQASQQSLMVANNVINSVFAASDESELRCLNTKDTALSQEKASLESSLSLLNAEYTSVEKQEDQEAKNAAPKFGSMG